MKLPLTLTVRRVLRGGEHLDLDCVVHDAAGESVQALPLTVSASRSRAEVVAILQAHVDQIARAAHTAGRAEPEEQSQEKDFASLEGATFTGSVLR